MHLHQLYKDLYITDYENKIAELKEQLKANVEVNMEQTMTIDKLKKDAQKKNLINQRRNDEIRVLQTQKRMMENKKLNAKAVRE